MTIVSQDSASKCGARGLPLEAELQVSDLGRCQIRSDRPTAVLANLVRRIYSPVQSSCL